MSHPVPQPDNAEYLLQKSGVTLEACLAGKRMDEKGPLFWTDMSELYHDFFFINKKLNSFRLPKSATKI